MNLSLSNILSLIWATLRDPRGGLRFVLNQPLSMNDRWLVFGLAVILPTILIALVLMVVPVPEGMMLSLSPISLAVSQGFGMALMVLLAHFVGRMRGGRGTFAETLLTVAWLQIIMVIIQGTLLLLELALPMVASLIGLLATVLIFWLLTNFIVELHGFTSLPLTFLGIIGTLVVAVFLLALILAPFMGVPNV